MNGVTRAIGTLKAEGVGSTAWRSGKWLTNRFNRFVPQPLSSVYIDDVIAVDWSRPVNFNARVVVPPASGYRVTWIITPPSETSGGHQNAFRFMRFLEDAGHQLTVFLYAAEKYPRFNLEAIRTMLAQSSGYPKLEAPILRYNPDLGLPGEYDAVIASNWESAYASYRHGADAKRLYFVQDFEASFYAAGSDHALAENTYRFGFHGLTAGRWLARALQRDYGMSCDSYDFAVDTAVYRNINSTRRTEIVCYVRPPTPRRATEFSLLVLREVHRLRPDITINLVGWDMSGYAVPFPFVNHAAVSVAVLNAIYNRCAAGLALSLTNMSLVPMELMASGCVPVVNDADNTRGVFDSPYVEYVPMSPRAMAERLIAIVDRADAAEHAAMIAESVAGGDWADSGHVFVEHFEHAMQTSL
ncbi:MAG TPA: glycosyltransferase family 1 protein [Microbacteriaceae bacterium]